MAEPHRDRLGNIDRDVQLEKIDPPLLADIQPKIQPHQGHNVKTVININQPTGNDQPQQGPRPRYRTNCCDFLSSVIKAACAILVAIVLAVTIGVVVVASWRSDHPRIVVVRKLESVGLLHRPSLPAVLALHESQAVGGDQALYLSSELRTIKENIGVLDESVTKRAEYINEIVAATDTGVEKFKLAGLQEVLKEMEKALEAAATMDTWVKALMENGPEAFGQHRIKGYQVAEQAEDVLTALEFYNYIPFLPSRKHLQHHEACNAYGEIAESAGSTRDLFRHFLTEFDDAVRHIHNFTSVNEAIFHSPIYAFGSTCSGGTYSLFELVTLEHDTGAHADIANAPRPPAKLKHPLRQLRSKGISGASAIRNVRLTMLRIIERLAFQRYYSGVQLKANECEEYQANPEFWENLVGAIAQRHKSALGEADTWVKTPIREPRVSPRAILYAYEVYIGTLKNPVD